METNKEWTKEDIEYLKKNYWDKDYEDISKELNKSYNSIANKVYRLNLPRKKGKVGYSNRARRRISETRKKLMKEGKIKPPLKFSEEKANKLKGLYEKGYQSGEIIKEMGVSYASISRYTKERKDYKRKEQIKGFINNFNGLSENEKGYIAGLLDGEGSVGIIKSNKKYYAPYISISNQDTRIINYLYKKLSLWTKIYLQKQKVYAPLFSIRIFGEDMVMEFLNLILPYTHSEKTERRAKITLEFCKAKTQKRREELYNKMRVVYRNKK